MKAEYEYSANQVEVQRIAIETFGSESLAKKWLTEPHKLLESTPIAFAVSDLGATEVKKILSAISLGGVV